MHILVLGSGGREHALCWKIAQSPNTQRVYCAPGNAGTAEIAENIALSPDDAGAIIAFCQEKSIDLVVIGPEAPLVAGIADNLRESSIPVFGPSSAAAQLESSKAFTRNLCDEAGIPGARWQACHRLDEARKIVQKWGAPIVIKADGLAAGKGVVVAGTLDEALHALDEMMAHQSLGSAADVVLIEECLIGLEASLFVLCDGTTALPLALARDHKRIGEGDTGANTGGMGCFTPIGGDQAIIDEVMEKIIAPSLLCMQKRGTPFQGILFAGLMLTQEGTKLIEYNVRFGDPECQSLMLRLKSDLVPYLDAATQGKLAEMPPPDWYDESVVNIVLTAPGYPAKYPQNMPLPALPQNTDDNVIFHAGTTRDAGGNLVTAGGRVLNICARGKSLCDARNRAYLLVENIGWQDGYYRRDIANATD